MKNYALTFVASAALCIAGCGDDKGLCGAAVPVTALGVDYFTDISAPSGIQANNFVPMAMPPIPINDHSRLGFADLDGDGYDDVVMHSLFPNVQKGVPFEHLVFMNNHDGTFRDASDASGLRAIQAGFFVFGDVDNDGDQDCFAGLDLELPDLGNELWLNDGMGHFTKKDGAGFDSTLGKTHTANAVFGDFNNDGKLDLFLGNGSTTNADTNQYFVGNGDGSFTEQNGALHGGDNIIALTNGLVTCDYDNDGDLDIIVSTYSWETSHHVLWRNDGQGGFDDAADQTGFGAQLEGNYYLAESGYGTLPQPDATDLGQWASGNGFGVECQDVNGDGLPDIYLAEIAHPDKQSSSDARTPWSDPSLLLINQGPDAGYAFKNEFLARKLPFNEGDIDNAMIDFDNDGRIDLAMTRDNKYDTNYKKAEIEQKSWFGLFHQLADGTFESTLMTNGINDPQVRDPNATFSPTEALRMKAGQNQAWSDIDHDGDLDLLVGGRDHMGGRANYLFRNEIGSKNGWLGVKLRGDGVTVNRDAIGARVTITGTGAAAGRILAREVKSSRGTYDSMDMRTLLFGLGDLGCEFTMEVRWPNGTVTQVKSKELPLQSYVTIVYGQGLVLPATMR